MDASVDYSNTYVATLVRQQPNEPWGVRIHGGTDTGQPLTVHQVRRKSPASKAGVKEGDFVTLVDDRPTDYFTHQHMTDTLSTAALTLRLTLARNLQPPATNGHRSRYDDVSMTSMTAQYVSDVRSKDYKRAKSAVDGERKREAIYRMAHRVQVPQTVKDYQPYDLLGGHSSVSTQRSSGRHVYQIPATSIGSWDAQTAWTPVEPSPAASASSAAAAAAAGAAAKAAAAAVLSVNLLDYNNYSNGTCTDEYGRPEFYQVPDRPGSTPLVYPYAPLPPPLAVTTRTGRQVPATRRQKPPRWYDDTDLSNFEAHCGPPRQSRSFHLIETALEMQGAGETGLPTPPTPQRSATGEQPRWDEHQHLIHTDLIASSDF